MMDTITVDNFNVVFHHLIKRARQKLLKKMVNSLNKAQLDILLKHLEKISFKPTKEDEPTENTSNSDLKSLELIQFYETIDVAKKLRVLVDIINNLQSCDSEDLVEILDTRLDELINNNEVSDDDCDENEDHENTSEASDDVVFVDPTVSYSEETEGDLENSNNSVLSGLSYNNSAPKLQFPTHFLQSSLHHQLEDEEESKFCDLCDKFVKKKGWYKHMNTVHSTQRFSCTLCPNSKFKAKKYWKAHMRNIHKDLNIQFPDGRTAGASTFGLLGPGLHCGECGMPFTSVDLLKQHSDTVHKQSSPEDENMSEVEDDDSEDIADVCIDPIQCKICFKLFKTQTELSAHDQACHSSSSEFAQCPYCLIMTKSLRNHIKFVHMKKFQCELCQKSFSANAKLTRHLESHLRGTNRIHNPSTEHLITTEPILLPKDRPKNITCDLCGYKCVSTWKLNRHMNAHRKGTNRFSLH